MKTAALPSPPDTRLKLLEAAGEIFARQGFRLATVREICARAGANVAAVNYHFGDKEGLYTAALQHWFAAARQKYPPEGGLPMDAPPQDRLRVFVRSFLFRMLDTGAPAWHGQLMAREMIEPTRAADLLARDDIGPMEARLRALIRELLGPAASDEQVRYCTLSVAGQCCFYRHSWPMIHRLYPDLKLLPEEIERIAEHITRFTLQGLSIYQEGSLR